MVPSPCQLQGCQPGDHCRNPYLLAGLVTAHGHTRALRLTRERQTVNVNTLAAAVLALTVEPGAADTAADDLPVNYDPQSGDLPVNHDHYHSSSFRGGNRGPESRSLAKAVRCGTGPHPYSLGTCRRADQATVMTSRTLDQWLRFRLLAQPADTTVACFLFFFGLTTWPVGF